MVRIPRSVKFTFKMAQTICSNYRCNFPCLSFCGVGQIKVGTFFFSILYANWISSRFLQSFFHFGFEFCNVDKNIFNLIFEEQNFVSNLEVEQEGNRLLIWKSNSKRIRTWFGSWKKLVLNLELVKDCGPYKWTPQIRKVAL